MDAASLARRTAGFSGADLSNLVNEAALAAGKGNHAQITSQLLDEAQDKILMGSERRCALLLPNPFASRARGYCLISCLGIILQLLIEVEAKSGRTPRPAALSMLLLSGM